MIELFMIGNLGSDAVVNFKNGQPVINFNICHSESTKKRNIENGIFKVWVDCAYYVDNPELVSMLTKGVKVYVKGMPFTKTHINKDGDPISVQCLRVYKMEVLSSKRKEETT
jgi:single-stranded DNA-binding protein